MKLVSSLTILESIKLQLRLGNVSRISSYSTATRNLTTERRSSNPDSNSMRGLIPSYHASGRSNGLHCSPARSMGPRRTNRRARTAPTLHQRVAILQTIHSRSPATSDVEGIDKIVNLMESCPTVLLDWELYATAASGYAKAGFLDKSLQMLKKSEGLISHKSCFEAAKAYEFLITQYATTRQKDEVLRLWEIYKKNATAYNRGYISVIKSLLKFDDLESAEKIFEEWQSQSSIYDFRIPQFLIGCYCRKGLLQKAESLISKEKLKGGKVDGKTWFYMATGYLKNNQTLEAVEVMKEALVVCRNKWKPSKERLASSLTFLNNGVEDIEGVEKFINLLREKDIISEDLQEKWLSNVQNGKLNFDALSSFYVDALIDDAEAL
ncbi:hypothetical protein Pint_36276 [Pistacia integerrima]|uniref:Uncharacterized protein n=1 Tax=Pistacia integerrima TaxID=434235 RepID=A0ACC0Y1Y5_9ROSI|nr:hypothetical protein Pint_36276 [Pistacia integerrima]